MDPDQSLRFTRVEVRNWRNFRHVSAELAERAYIVGPNASGKTNLLDVFRFLRDLVNPLGGGLASAVTDRGGIKQLRCLEAKGRMTDIVVDVDVGTTDRPSAWSYKLVFSQARKPSDFPVIKAEEIKKDGRPVEIRKRDGDDDLAFSQTLLQQTAANLKFRELAKFFESIRYLNVIPQIIRDDRRAVKDEEDFFGGDLLKKIADKPKRTRESRLKRINAALKIVLPQFVDLRFENDKMGKPHLVAKFDHWRLNPSDQNERVFSDGTLRLIGFLWSILDEGGPLLLEEPELNLHEDAVAQLSPMIARMQRDSGRQVIITTHSNALIGMDSGVGPHEVLILTPGNNGTKLASANVDKDIVDQYSSGLPMADIVRPLTRPKNINQLSLFDQV